MLEWLKKIIGIVSRTKKPSDDAWPKILPDYVVKVIPKNCKEPAANKLQRDMLQGGIIFKEEK